MLDALLQLLLIRLSPAFFSNCLTGLLSMIPQILHFFWWCIHYFCNVGKESCEHCFSRLIGTTSNSQNFVAIELMHFLTCSSDNSLNCRSGGTRSYVLGSYFLYWSNDSLILRILLANSLAKSLSDLESGIGFSTVVPAILFTSFFKTWCLYYIREPSNYQFFFELV